MVYLMDENKKPNSIVWRALHRLDYVLGPFMQLEGGSMNLNEIRVFLYIARNPGTGNTEIARALGYDQSYVSNIVSILGSRGRSASGRKPLDFVYPRYGYEDERRKHLYLTSKGIVFVNTIIDHMGLDVKYDDED